MGTSDNAEKMTTMMVRNLPPRYVQDRFIALLDSYGFDGTYDFVYVPHAASNKNKNKGYAFVNFLNAEYAKRLREVWDLQCIFHAEQSTRSLTRSVRIPRRSLKGVSVGYAADFMGPIIIILFYK